MILLTGGTGLLGSHLLFRLLNEGEEVRAIHRQHSELEKVARVFSYYRANSRELFERIQWVQADINDLPSLERAFENVDLVYHCAALLTLDPARFPLLKKINVEGTSNVVNLCLHYKVKKLCYASSIAALGKIPVHGKITEESEWTPFKCSAYAISKHAAEMEVWRASQEGLPVVIINPGIILGPGFWESGSGKLFSVGARGPLYYPPGGSGFISVNDAARIMIQLMNSNFRDERYIAVDRNLSYREVLTQISRQLGKPSPKLRLRAWQLQFLWRLDWLRSRLSGRERTITKMGVHSLTNPRSYSNKKLLKALNYKFEMLAESIYFSCNRFKEENRA